MRAAEILTEVDWFDKSPLIDVLQKHRGRFLHMTKVPKLGVNPTKLHNDPHGIYFYPVDWVLQKPERVARGEQYGLNSPYYFICDADLSAHGVTLSSLTMGQLERIAAANGWDEYLNAFLASDDQGKRAMMTAFASWKTPGHILWHLLDGLQRKKLTTWNKALKGIAFIHDDGNGIIHPNEPSQLLVFDPRILRVVEMGENTPIDHTKSDPQSFIDQWRRPTMAIMKGIQEMFGGDITYRSYRDLTPYRGPNKKPRAPGMPQIRFAVGEHQFELYFTTRHGDISLYLEARFRRERETRQVAGFNDFLNGSIEDIVSKVEAVVGTISMETDDLRFDPLFTPEEATSFIKDRILGEGVNAPTSVEIDNDPRGGGTYARIWVSSEHQVRGVGITTRVMASIDREQIKVFAQLRGKESVLWPREVASNDLETAADLLFERVTQSLADFRDNVGPSADSFSRAKLFYYESDLDACIGFLATESGLSFDGRMGKTYAKEIAVWNGLGQYDKASIIDKLKRYAETGRA